MFNDRQSNIPEFAKNIYLIPQSKHMKISVIPISLLLIIFLFSFAQCKKSDTGLNIILHDKPLNTIQSYIQGKWKLQYTFGGFAAMKYPATHNSYIILNPNNIIIGNDSAGVVVDTAIIWVRAKDIAGDSTYLLTYSYTPGYAFPYAYIVDRIYNDTLVLSDNAYDPISRYYTKFN